MLCHSVVMRRGATGRMTIRLDVAVGMNVHSGIEVTTNPSKRLIHGDAIFIKLLGLRETTVDIDYLAAYTNALLRVKD